MRRPRLAWRAPGSVLIPVGVALALGAPGCGAHSAALRAPRAAAANTSAAPVLVTPAHLVAVPDSSSVSYKQRDDDGTVRLVAHGMRLLMHPDGSVERAQQLLPAVQSVHTLELPRRLGQGYVFYVRSSSRTLIWRAKTWTGPLQPLANVDFDVASVVAGFDRLYLVDRATRNVIAIDADTGRVTDAGALPPSPAYGGIAISDAWTGAVQVPYRGVLATFDAGASWHQVTSKRSYSVALHHGRIAIRLLSGTYVLDPSGALAKYDRSSDRESMFRGAGQNPADVSWVNPPDDSTEPSKPPPAGPLGRRPLDLAVLRGFPDSKTTAVVAAAGAVGRVRLSDGALLDVAEDAFPRGSICDGIELGHSFGFVCGEERGSTVVYAFKPPLSLEPVLSFDEPRYVASSGNGALVIRGPCTGHARDNPGAYCIRSREGALSEIHVKGDLGVERVVALSDGRAAVIVPPRLGAPGLLVLIERSGKTKSVKMQLPPKAKKSILALLSKGLWLDGFVERKPGELAGWVAAGGPFIGVRLHLDGKVQVGKLENDIDRSLLSGQLALSLGDSGLAAETIDGGFKWREVELPVDTTSSSYSVSPSDGPRGCSRVGCAFGSWLRVGWRGPGSHESKLASAEPPRPTVLPPSGGGRWLLTCAPTGKQRGERLAPRSKRRTRRRRFARPPPSYPGSLPSPDQLQSTAWKPFFGEPPPSKSPEQVGFDNGTEYAAVKVHGYVWGARGASWDRVGRFQMRALDRFSLDHAIWSTAPTRSPWDDMSQAAQAFGVGSYSGAPNWSAMLDPSGRGGVVLINPPSSPAELFLVDEGRSAIKVEGVGKQGLSSLGGVVKLGSTWYVGSEYSSSEFRVFRIEGSRMQLLGRFPTRVASQASGAVATLLVRNARGDALGILAKPQLTGASSSTFVFPIDLQTHEAGAPLELTASALASALPCGDDDDDGWLIEDQPSPPPYMDFVGDADGLRVRNSIAARVLASAHGVCIDSLAAEADSQVPARLHAPAGGIAGWARGRQTVTLVVSGRGGGARWGFRCMR